MSGNVNGIHFNIFKAFPCLLESSHKNGQGFLPKSKGWKLKANQSTKQKQLPGERCKGHWNPKDLESNAYFQMISHQWKYEELATTFPKQNYSWMAIIPMNYDRG